MITECTIYMVTLGAIAIWLGIWCSILYTKNRALQLKAAENELARVEAEGRTRVLLIENDKLYNDLKNCRRERDNKGRYIKK